MSEERILSRYILLFAFLLLLALGYMAFEAQASTSNRYMLLYHSVQGLNLEYFEAKCSIIELSHKAKTARCV